MNNKKDKVVTHVADLIKPNKNKLSTIVITKVAELIKPNKQDKVATNIADLIKSDKKDKAATNIVDLIKTPKKYLYPCHCICYRGIEVVSRTQEKHTENESLWRSETSR